MVKVIRRNRKPQVIDIIISVDEGRQYRLKDISFTEETVFPVAAMRRQFPIKAGDIFDTEKIRTGLENLRKLYGASGYINFTPVPDTKIDDDAGLISLDIDIDEGQLFHWGELIVNGLESQPGARERLLEAWRAYKRTPYNGDIALKHLLRDIHALPNVNRVTFLKSPRMRDQGSLMSTLRWSNHQQKYYSGFIVTVSTHRGRAGL